MMLKPFRIRNLCDSQNAVAGSLDGVVQLSATQYDFTLKTNPEAALNYIDEDDGETIYVGSSFELDQRLNDPVVTRPKCLLPNQLATQLHSFDIQPTTTVMDTWRAYEVSQKNGDKPSPTVSQPQQANPVKLETAVSEALQGLDTHVQSFAEFLVDASNILRNAAEQSREPNAIEGILIGFQGIFAEVGKVGEAMVKAFNCEIAQPNDAPKVDSATASTSETPVPTTEDVNTSSDAIKTEAENTSQVSSPVTAIKREEDNDRTPATTTSSYICKLEASSDSDNAWKDIEQQPISEMPSPRREPTQTSAPSLVKEENTEPPASRPRLWLHTGRDVPRRPTGLAAAIARGEARRGIWHAAMDFDPDLKEVRAQGVEHVDPRVNWPRETAKAFHRPDAIASRSILDLEDSDPDFAARFPSLMSLEREIASSSKTSSQVPSEITKATHKLPGAWPESRVDADGPTLPTSEESSGAFFDRMTRNREYFRRKNPFSGRSVFTGDDGPQLGRSKTVTSSNPAGRLSHPFDPLEDFRGFRERGNLPQRSGTERFRRRPYTERFTGAGRMPWESFEGPEAQVQVRPSRSTRVEPQPDTRVSPHSTQSPGVSSKVQDCVQQLKSMGYGDNHPNEYSRMNLVHEPNRLEMYAVVCNGSVEEAVEMLEEDKKAHARFWGGAKQAEGQTEQQQQQHHQQSLGNPMVNAPFY